MQVIVWSKNDCPHCDTAKQLLKMKGFEYEERNLSMGEWSKDHLLQMVPNARSVPQIFFGNEYVGGFKELKERLG